MSNIPSFRIDVDLPSSSSFTMDQTTMNIKPQATTHTKSIEMNENVILMANSKMVRIFREESASIEENMYLAMFVPPIITSQINNILSNEKKNYFSHFLNSHIKKVCSKEYAMDEYNQESSSDTNIVDGFQIPLQTSIHYGIYNERTKIDLKRVLSQIHPKLVDFVIHSILDADQTKLNGSKEVKSGEPAATDLIIFRLPQASENTIDEEQKLPSIQQSVTNLMHSLDGEKMANLKTNVIKIFLVSHFNMHDQFQTAPALWLTYDISFRKQVMKLIFSKEKQFHSDLHTETPKMFKKLSGFQIPSCPVCLHRIDPVCVGFPSPKSHQLCSYTCLHSDCRIENSCIEVNQQQTNNNMSCTNRSLLSPWPFPAYCLACHIIDNHQPSQSIPHTASNVNFSDDVADLTSQFQTLNLPKLPSVTSCYECGMNETLWVCLICGIVGCGRYSHFHAGKHYHETGHGFSLELVTQRIWDYAADSFVQRIDYLTCPAINRTSSNNASTIGNAFPSSAGRHRNESEALSQTNAYPPRSFPGHHLDPSRSSHFGNDPPKKAIMIGEEYEALIQSALEDQAQHFEGEISRLRAELTAQHLDEEKISEKESQEIQELQSHIQNLRSDVDCMGKELLEGQAQEALLRSASKRLLREQANSQELLDKVRAEAAREHKEGKTQVEELEQQIRDLTTNLKIMQKFAQDKELRYAEIFKTNPKAPKRGGKKGRRSRR